MLNVAKIVILFTLTLLFSCKKNDPDPVPPVITFLDAQLSQDKSYSIVTFEFFDGDGDLGLKQNENSGEQEYNLLVDYYEKSNGVWLLKSPIITWNTNENKFDTTSLNARIPFIENETNGELRGETKVNLFYNNFTVPDTFRYEITIKDRALHLSNKIVTTEILTN